MLKSILLRLDKNLSNPSRRIATCIFVFFTFLGVLYWIYVPDEGVDLSGRPFMENPRRIVLGISYLLLGLKYPKINWVWPLGVFLSSFFVNFYFIVEGPRRGEAAYGMMLIYPFFAAVFPLFFIAAGLLIGIIFTFITSFFSRK